MPEMVSLLRNVEPAFIEPFFLSAPEQQRQPLVHISTSQTNSAADEPTLLTGTVSSVQIRSKTFLIQPDPSHGCWLSCVSCRLEHVRNAGVTAWNLSGRKVVSFRLGEGEVENTFEAFDVVLEDNIDPDDDDHEELLFQPEEPTDAGSEHTQLEAGEEDESQEEASESSTPTTRPHVHSEREDATISERDILSSFPIISEDRLLTPEEKERAHHSGRCRPCAYFNFKADGCDQGDLCKFCHICIFEDVKNRKRDYKKEVRRSKRRSKKSQKANVNMSVDDDELLFKPEKPTDAGSEHAQHEAGEEDESQEEVLTPHDASNHRGPALKLILQRFPAEQADAKDERSDATTTEVNHTSDTEDEQEEDEEVDEVKYSHQFQMQLPYQQTQYPQLLNSACMTAHQVWPAAQYPYPAYPLILRPPAVFHSDCPVPWCCTNGDSRGVLCKSCHDGTIPERETVFNHSQSSGVSSSICLVCKTPHCLHADNCNRGVSCKFCHSHTTTGRHALRKDTGSEEFSLAGTSMCLMCNMRHCWHAENCKRGASCKFCHNHATPGRHAEKSKTLTCHLCSRVMSSEKQLKQHLNGKAHADAASAASASQTLHQPTAKQQADLDATGEVGSEINVPVLEQQSDFAHVATVSQGAGAIAVGHQAHLETATQETADTIPTECGHEQDLLNSLDPWARALVSRQPALKLRPPPGLEHVQIETGHESSGSSAFDARSDEVAHSSEEAFPESAKVQQYSGDWKVKSDQHKSYQSDNWDPYHFSRVVDSASLVAQPCALSDDSPENRHYCVLKTASLDSFASVSENAVHEIKSRSEHSRSGDMWTHKSLLTYLRYRWVRLIEQGRVLHLFVFTRKSQTCMDMFERGYSQHVVLFHTGLIDAQGEPIFAVLVQDLHNKGRYLLRQSGVHSMVNGKLPEWWCRLLKSSEIHVNGPAYREVQVIDSLMNASYFKGRDQRRLFDPTLEVRLDYKYIVEQNLDRLIVGGLDVEEAWFHDRAATESPLPGNWRFHCHEGNKIRELKYDDNYNSFVFSRRNLGKKSAESLLKQWLQASMVQTAYNINLVVQHFYYKLCPLRDGRQVYVGRLQLLLPLVCDGTVPMLALSVQFKDSASPHYFSDTVLTIRMANNTARQITTAQVPWIRVPEAGDDEL